VRPQAAKASSGCSSSNNTGPFLPSIVSYSLKEVKGTKQQLTVTSQRFQCALLKSRIFVVPLPRLQP
jgi:hypothetical protein